MTPQLRQAIRLLQLSTLELRTEIQEQLDSNIMLEPDEDQAELPHTSDKDDKERDSTEAASQLEGAPDGLTEASEITDPELNKVANEDSAIPDELPVDTDWDSLYDPSPIAKVSTSAADSGQESEYYEIAGASRSMNLEEHLLWQLNMSPMSDSDRLIALCLIDDLDHRGYLSSSLEELVNGLNAKLEQEGSETIDIEEAQIVLARVQRLDPVGCGARNPSECLTRQLETCAPDTPALSTAKRIANEFLTAVAAGDMKKLTRRLQVKEPEIHRALALIRSLDPYPGEQFNDNTAAYVVPDIFVRPYKGGWRVELNPDIAPRLRVNDSYARFVKRGDQGSDNAMMKEHLQEARWFIKSLQSRNETLLKVATAIVERQSAFLEHGDEAMHPMVLRDIAEAVDMHESTISRVTTNKYMHTPNGVLEFKYFFSSHVGTSDGGECSATAIRAKLRKLIAEENSAKPLSDNKLAQMLAESGIEVARRTVAKYRESMNIPPSNERKRIG